ncbi:MAG: ribosomal-processing cysteine protease Prp [Clostridiales bacterium]|nr:ribosomal-processing cysteine protease Prp [Clostridiales bacterium]
MIQVNISRNSRGRMYGFTARNHGEDIVCAAVSALILNAVNSVEAFTDEDMTVDIDKKNTGYIKLYLPDIEAGNDNSDADLLLSSMLLGLEHIQEQYPGQICIEDYQIEDYQ